MASMPTINIKAGVLVVYDVSSATRTAQFENRLGGWETGYEYQIYGAKYGVEFSENTITADGLVQYVHLEPWRNDSDDWASPEVAESVIDELLSNGWSLADG